MRPVPEVAMAPLSKSDWPSVSVIINTDGRVGSLAVCLESLRYLRYPNFEVVVVAGPTRDGTHELCERYGSSIRFAECPERNLSMSRNLSIQISSGELVGFLDDDSIPEPEWLDDVVPAFRDPNVGVAGGFLHDHTGKSYQWTFGSMDRYGNADTTWNRATPEFNFPGSFHYPHVMANSVFRRSAMAEAGGFDEQYEYFLDESDIILRFVDSGWKVAQLDRGFIHHKFMPSHIRNQARVLTSWYSVIKNKTYFALLNGGGHITTSDVLAKASESVAEFRTHVQWAIGAGHLDASRTPAFEQEVEHGLRDGLLHGLRGLRRLVDPETLNGQKTFVRFTPYLVAAEQYCYVFLTRTYPPGSVGGIGRFMHHLARNIALQGHQVHVLTEGSAHDRVDFEEGVWVHRITPRYFTVPMHLDVPQHIWNHSRTMLEEAHEIAERRPVRAVAAPIWDAEGIAFLEDGAFALFTFLQTTLAMYLDSNPERAADDDFMQSFGHPMLAIERRLVSEASGVIAHSDAIVSEMERLYAMQLPPARTAVVALGLDDWSQETAESPADLPGKVRICFVGRLERRKGADVFLAIVPNLLLRYPQVHVDLVGNDAIVWNDGRTLRERFETDHPDLRDDRRLRFHGEVSDTALRGFYDAAAIVVAPSRFESFGLVHLEAMMFGKVVVGCEIGGMKEVVENGVTGLLAVPGDEASLLRCLEELIGDPERRAALGRAARDAYLSRFTARNMATNTLRRIDETLGRTAS